MKGPSVDIYSLALHSGWGFACVFGLGIALSFAATRISKQREALRGCVFWLGVALALFSPYLLSYLDALVWYVPAFWRFLGLFGLGTLGFVALMAAAEDRSCDGLLGWLAVPSLAVLVAAGGQLEAVLQAISVAYAHGEVLAALAMGIPVGLFLLPLVVAGISAALGAVAAFFALLGFV